MSLVDDVDVDVDVDVLRQIAIEQNLAFGVVRLRKQYRMKPKVGATPAKLVKSPYWSKIQNPIYYVKDCVPIRQIKQSEPTAAQLLGRQISGLKATLRSKPYKSARKIYDLMNDKYDDLVVLDTETTGLDSKDQVIELAIIDMRGDTLFAERFKPTVAIQPKAMEVHGIDDRALINCASWPEHQESINKILKNKTVLIFNKEFDLRMMRQTAIAFNCDTHWLNNFNTVCIMYAAAGFYGATNHYGTISLSNAAEAAGVEWTGEAHTAIADCEMTRCVANDIAFHYRHFINKLNDAENKKQKLID